MINYDDFQPNPDPVNDPLGLNRGQPPKKSHFVTYSSVLFVVVFLGIMAYQTGLLNKFTALFNSYSRDVSVTVTGKTSLPSNIWEGRALDQISVDVDVKNKSSRVIRGVEGKLTIYDMFDKKLMTEQADITGRTIKAGETISYNFLFHANSLIEKEMTAFESDFKDLKFSYEVTKIVYK